MKKRILALTMILVLALAISAQAAMWSASINPRIEFNGTSATCIVSVRGEVGDAITVRAKLWQGSACLKDWQASGVVSVILSKPATVVKGETYRLTADVTIDGVKHPTKAYSATCP